MFNFFFFKSVIHFYFKFYFNQNKNVFFIYYKVLNSFKMLKKKFTWVKNVNFNNKGLRCRLKTYSSEMRISKNFSLRDYRQEVVFLGAPKKSLGASSYSFEDHLSGFSCVTPRLSNSSTNFRVQSRSLTFPFSKKGRVI